MSPPTNPVRFRDSAVLRFYLPRRGDVSVTVRQLRPGSTYYVLDQVKKVWRAGEVNDYVWSTKILRKLSGVRPDDLGAVVNLDSNGNPNHEKVLPVALFSANSPGGNRSYRFSLKTDFRARIEATLVHEKTRISLRSPNWEEDGSPFTVTWTPQPSDKEAWYRLVLSGQFDDGSRPDKEDGSRLDKEVEFYHKPVWPPVPVGPK